MKVYRLTEKQENLLKESAEFVGCAPDLILRKLINENLSRLSGIKRMSEDSSIIDDEPDLTLAEWRRFLVNECRVSFNLPIIKRQSTKC